MDTHPLDKTNFMHQTDYELEQWAYYLKHAEEMDELPARLTSNAGIVWTFNALREAKTLKDKMWIYELASDRYRRAMSHVEWRKEMRIKIEIAQNLLHLSVDIEKIAQATGLSIEAIEKLKMSKKILNSIYKETHENIIAISNLRKSS